MSKLIDSCNQIFIGTSFGLDIKNLDTGTIGEDVFHALEK